MKTIFITLSIFTLVSATLKDKFESWLTEFKIDVQQLKKTYGKDIDSCFQTWIEHEKEIIEHNFSNSTFKLGHNKFSCLNSEEFKKFNGFRKFEAVRRGDRQSLMVGQKFPESLDWQELGAVTDVASQGSCGSCWSFSTTGSLEGAYQIKYGTLKSFSEQQLVSCDTRKNRENPGTDLSCNGGMMDSAFGWIEKNDGLCTEQDYPYTSGNGDSGDCLTTCQVDTKADIQSFVDVTPNSDDALMSALTVGPVSIAIQADQKKFQLYKSGVLSGTECGNDLDHGVLVVGWGVESGTPYWKVKNSWDTTWGNDGYILLERGTSANGGAGTCGILSCASYPVL